MTLPREVTGKARVGGGKGEGRPLELTSRPTHTEQYQEDFKNVRDAKQSVKIARYSSRHPPVRVRHSSQCTRFLRLSKSLRPCSPGKCKHGEQKIPRGLDLACIRTPLASHPISIPRTIFLLTRFFCALNPARHTHVYHQQRHTTVKNTLKYASEEELTLATVL